MSAAKHSERGAAFIYMMLLFVAASIVIGGVTKHTASGVSKNHGSSMKRKRGNMPSARKQSHGSCSMTICSVTACRLYRRGMERQAGAFHHSRR